MMLYLLFLINFFTSNIYTAADSRTKLVQHLPRNSSSADNLANWFKNGPKRVSSQSPHSRSSSAARSTNGDQFYTPKGSPIPAALNAQQPTVPQLKSSQSLSDWDLTGNEEAQRWQDTKKEFDVFVHRDGTTTYQLKYPLQSKPSKIKQLATTVSEIVKEATTVVSLLPGMIEEWKNNAY